MSYPRERMAEEYQDQLDDSSAKMRAREREALIQTEATKYLERIRTQDPVVLARQLAEENIAFEEQNSSLRERIDRDEFNPDIFSENGFHRQLSDLLEERAREIHQLQRTGAEIPSRVPGLIGYLDLDRFKDVNDAFGHDEGDIILNIVGQIVASEVRPGDAVARLHGDEYAFFLNDIEDMVLGIHIAERIRDAVINNIPVLTGYNLELSASIGLVPFPTGNILEQLQTDLSRQILVNEMLKKADTVHSQGAKHAGRNRIGVLLDNEEGPIKTGSIKTAVLTPNPDDPAGRPMITFVMPQHIPNIR